MLSGEPARPIDTSLHATTLRGVVGVHDAEARARAVRPFEVVHQGPDEIAAEGNASGNGGRGRVEVARKEGDARRIIDAIVDDQIVVCGTVLGDVNIPGRVVA